MRAGGAGVAGIHRERRRAVIDVRSNRPGVSARGSAGFTLIEMILSMTIVMVIFGATYSVIRLASRVVPNPGNPQTCLLEGSRALDQLVADLGYATAVVDFKADSVTFNVSDRTGDGLDETLRYWWGGTAGDPLRFSINGAPGTPIAEDVREFALVADQGSRVTPSVYTWGNEILLMSHNPLVNLGSFKIDASYWCAEYFLPALASDARNWKLTRARIMMRANGSPSGPVVLAVQSASGGMPSTTVLDQCSVDENLLGPSFAWQPFLFSAAPPTPASTGLCLVTRTAVVGAVCDIQYQNLLYLGGSGTLHNTDNGGSSWATPSGQNMVYEVYGKVETVQAGVSQAFLEQVKCALRLGPSASSRVEMTARVLNQPVLP